MNSPRTSDGESGSYAMHAAKRIASRVAMPLRGSSLTVLCYHRICDEVRPDQLAEVVSTSSQGFEEHLDLLEDRFNIVAMHDVVAWLSRDKSLPPRAAMVTFDDGYRDNYTVAYPILKGRGLPATIFLTTDHIDSGEPFWWDRAAYAFHHAEVSDPDLPFLGTRDISDHAMRQVLMKEWIEAAKRAPDAMLRQALGTLEGALRVQPPADSFVDLQLTWHQVVEMYGNGITFGAHTRTHPILTRMPGAEAATEIRGSVDRVRAELGASPQSFAYPNGGVDDFNSEIEQLVHDEGVPLAFTLIDGPSARLGAVRSGPLAINRTYVGSSDDAERLALRVAGVPRMGRAS